MSFPINADPANGSAPLDSNQSGEVWFLPGTHINSTGTISVVTHQFTVPPGKALFFPVLTYWADDSDCPVFDTFTPEELLAFDAFLMLSPLSVGQHTIHVFAVVGPLTHPHSEKDITYQLTIAP